MQLFGEDSIMCYGLDFNNCQLSSEQSSLSQLLFSFSQRSPGVDAMGKIVPQLGFVHQ